VIDARQLAILFGQSLSHLWRIGAVLVTHKISRFQVDK
jgi:hypothetical protein